MEKRVLFIDLEDGHIFIDSTNRCEYWLRREFRKDMNKIINPAGIYTSNDHMKALQLTELISPSLPWKNYPINFEIVADKNDTNPTINRYYWTYDHFYYKEATAGCNDGSFTLYFKRSDPEIVNTYDGPKRVNRVINKSLTFLENEQSAGLRILRTATLEWIKEDLRQMGVTLDCDSDKPEIKETYHIYKSLANSYFGRGGFTTTPKPSFEEMREIIDNIHGKNKETKIMDFIDTFWKHNSIKIYNDRLELGYNEFKEPGKIVRIQDTKSKEIIEKNRDLFILFLNDMQNLCGSNLQLIFIPKEHKTILKSDLKQSVIVDHDGKGKFDYLLAKELIFCKYRNNGHYDWYDKLTQHRKIKEV